MYTIFVLGGYFGLRNAEIQNARWEWIDWERENMTVVQDRGFHTKNQQNRTIPLFKGGARWLSGLRKHSGYIYRPGATHWRPNYGRSVEFKRTFAYVCNLAGMPYVTAHLLRHSWITNLLNADAMPTEVADWAGHSGLWIQENYRHARKPRAGRTELL